MIVKMMVMIVMVMVVMTMLLLLLLLLVLLLLLLLMMMVMSMMMTRGRSQPETAVPQVEPAEARGLRPEQGLRLCAAPGGPREGLRPRPVRRVWVRGRTCTSGACSALERRRGMPPWRDGRHICHRGCRCLAQNRGSTRVW
jgi:hypothetical protein